MRRGGWGGRGGGGRWEYMDRKARGRVRGERGGGGGRRGEERRGEGGGGKGKENIDFMLHVL